MGTYRSALGRNVDMAALAAKNQRTRAVGNMSVNARGDTIDSHGRIITPVTEKVTTSYSKTVGNRSAQPVKNPAKKSTKDLMKEEMTDYEREMTESLEDDDREIEAIKAQEQGKK